MKTVKLQNGHEMSEDTFINRMDLVWDALEADGMEVYIAGRGADMDLEFAINEFLPKENFSKVLQHGRYKVDVKRVDNRSILKMNLC